MAQSPEFLTVQRHIADINSLISEADLPSFSSELLQAGLITDATHSDAIATTTGSGPGHKIASLTNEVMAKIRTTPGLFKDFANILETRDKEIASILRNKCSEYRQHQGESIAMPLLCGRL